MKKGSILLVICTVALSLGACQHKKNDETLPEKKEISSEIKEEKIEKETNPATVTVVDEEQKGQENNQ
ncbi:hypothetical protein [Carnobacterium divergens]|uniref:hypothetical protein n=1 Tax=Carnobacterium divergens TaxID=2748 RepID=UPI0010723BDA|nr:hypothetical protein [Carnobacterium divergens]MPQ22879.1 hypothetical protein [Carnobacterium divergens]TFI74711.1 hypothetical protein CKN81_03930 [Carnobacterium divergens]